MTISRRTGPPASRLANPVSRVCVAVVDSHDLTRAGLTRVLNSRYTVVPLTGKCPAPKVVLYSVDRDTWDEHDSTLHYLLRTTSSTIVATYWHHGSPSIELAQSCGVHGAVSKKSTAQELFAAIERSIAERDLAPTVPVVGDCYPSIAEAGLSSREVEVLKLIGANLTNQEIADHLYVSINTVKTYIRGAYRKIGVGRRVQAVIWGQRHGLTPPAHLVMTAEASRNHWAVDERHASKDVGDHRTGTGHRSPVITLPTPP